jgi:hypothetical protein
MWSEGDVVLHREVLSSGHCWAAFPVVVVRDEPELLVTYVASGTPFTFPPAPLRHPWQGRDRWRGHGSLMLCRPGEAYGVRLFWDGPEREFACWYINFQEPVRRVAGGYETQDLELDLVVHPDGRVERKDDELLAVRVEEGRFTQDQADEVRAEAERVERELAAGERWWNPFWALWEPDPTWA